MSAVGVLSQAALAVIVAVLIWSLLPALAGAAVLAAERGAPARITPRVAAVLSRDTCTRALLTFLRPVALWRPHTHGPGSDPAVLLLCERAAHRPALAFLCTFLGRRGRTWISSAEVSTSAASLDALAEQIADDVARVRQQSGRSQVDIVAHGISGLAAAWYLRHLGGDAHVRRLVTLGTPWAGTRTAVFSRRPVATAWLPGAPALDDLAPPPVPTWCVWSPDDPLVVPSSSALAPGAQSVQIDGVGHLDLMLSARALRAVAEALSSPAGAP